jgi:hypothetical protein
MVGWCGPGESRCCGEKMPPSGSPQAVIMTPIVPKLSTSGEATATLPQRLRGCTQNHFAE